jgi:hypothetical protein
MDSPSGSEFDFSKVNLSSIFEFKIEPSEETKYNPIFSMDNYNYTLNFTKFEGNRLHINLNFSTPLLISPEIIQDVLIVYVKPSELTNR